MIMNENLKEISGGDPELASEFISIFLEHFPLEQSHLKEAVDSSDLLEARRVVHSIEGSLPAIGSPLSISLLRDMGKAGRGEDIQGLRESFCSFEEEMDKVLRDLKDMIAENHKGFDL